MDMNANGLDRANQRSYGQLSTSKLTYFQLNEKETEKEKDKEKKKEKLFSR